MNNSAIRVDLEDSDTEVAPRLQTEEARLVRIIEAIQGVKGSKEWSTLKIEVFDNLLNVLEKDLKTEAEKTDPSPNKLNRLAGEMKWARRFSDLTKFENDKRVELQNIRKSLHGKESD